jgi:hypothetical protein
MTKKHFLAGLSLLVAFSLLLSACSTPQVTTEGAPTVDANAIYTQAAQTVQAGQSLTQAARPTSAPTNTAQPTFTMDPLIAAGLTATAGAVLPGANPAAGTATVTPTGQALLIPTATPGGLAGQPTPTRPVVAQPTGDKCEWVSNSPEDNTQIPKNASFDTTIRVRNSGTSTWNNRYALRYFAGDRMGAPSDFLVQGNVKPNDTYEFQFGMKAPAETGKKEVLFVVQNAEGQNMCFINIPLEITN